jgi:hypothetical protein
MCSGLGNGFLGEYTEYGRKILGTSQEGTKAFLPLPYRSLDAPALDWRGDHNILPGVNKRVVKRKIFIKDQRTNFINRGGQSPPKNFTEYQGCKHYLR